MSDLVLVGAQRRITMMVMVPGNRNPQPITFHPSTAETPNRVNRVPRGIWEMLLKKKGSPRQDMTEEQSPLTEYLETGLLWEMNSSSAQLVLDGKMKNVSPHGATGGAYRPKPREPEAVPGLQHLAGINSASVEQMTVEVPE